MNSETVNEQTAAAAAAELPGQVEIGGIVFENPFFLAPLAGITDAPFRRICRSFGAGAVYSEMISAKGLYYNDKVTEKLLTIYEDELPVVYQLFGSDPETMGYAADALSQRKNCMIDINMGCPVPKVVNTGAGSALMKDVALAAKITEAAVKAAGNVPVTVKHRAGWHYGEPNAVEMAKAVESAGAAAVAVHGRSRDQYYSGESHNDIIRDVKQAVNIPVIGNGDITDADSCVKMYEETGCDLVMIGRGSYGNPFIFDEIDARMNGREYVPPTLEEKMQVMLEHIRLILRLSEKNEELAMHEARKHAAWYMNGYYGSAKFRGRCYLLSSYAEAKALAEEFIQLQNSRNDNNL